MDLTNDTGKCAASGGLQEMSKLNQELTTCAVEGAQRFNSLRDEILSGRKARVFSAFSVVLIILLLLLLLLLLFLKCTT